MPTRGSTPGSTRRPSRYSSSSSRAIARKKSSARLRLLIERITREGLLKADPVTFFRRAECERLVALRRLTEPLLLRSLTRTRPLAIVDDLAVPPDRLPAVIRQLQDLLRRHGLMWTMNAYAGDGRIRLRPFLNLADPVDRARLEPLTAKIYEIALKPAAQSRPRKAVAWPAPSSCPGNMGSSFRFSARSRTHSIRRTCSIPARSSAMIRT